MLEYFMTEACENFIDGRETRKKQFMRALLWGKNSEGLTPLVLTAKMSCPGMFQLLINTDDVYRQLNTVEGISNVYEYDITEVDSAPECNGKSVLEMITAHSHDRPDEYFKFTEICPVLDLIRAKWKLYRTWYLGWGLVHLTMMVLNTYALMSLRTESQQTSVSILSLLQSTANPANTSTTEGHDMSYSYAAFPANLIVTDIFLAVYLVYVAYILGQEIYQFVRHSP